MTSFEGTVSTISPTGSTRELVGIEVDRADMFRSAIGRPIDIFLPTANGRVRGLARILRVEGTEATVEFKVDELALDQIADLFGADWRTTLTFLGAAVRSILIADLDRPPTLAEDAQGKGYHLHTSGGDPTCDICVELIGL